MTTDPLPHSALDLPSDPIPAIPSQSSPSPTGLALAPPNSAAAPTSSATTPSVSLYAEHLLHIRTVTLSASLLTPRTKTTRAVLSADGQEVSIAHEGAVAKVRLPVRVRLKPGAESGGGGEEKETLLEIPGASWGREISLRLSAGDEDGAAVEREGNCVPWGAAALNHPGKSGLVRVRCKRCDNTVVREGGVGEWRDLPNENWAEMMEFWHCHRPDHDHGHGDRKDGGKSKGYAAENQLRALNGVGFVDLGAFLLKEEDCEGVQVIPSAGSPPLKLLCQACKAHLGEVDERAEGFRLWKWSLAINNPTETSLKPKPANYSTPKWISAHFLSLIENQAVRKFFVKPGSDEGVAGDEKIMIWVFTPDLTFSTSTSTSSPSSTQETGPTRAMKVFYQLSSSTEEQTSFSVEEVRFPGFVFAELKRALVESGALMPEAARVFKTWRVGLLERFVGWEGERV